MPCPVTRPMRALTTWMPTISGVVRNTLHSIPRPNCAPACEYVAMPLGSSSAAPVMRPGPRRSRNRLPLLNMKGGWETPTGGAAV